MVARGSGPRRSSGARMAGFAVAALGALFGLSGCSIGDAFDGFGWPKGGITPESRQMYDLWVGSVVAALLVGFFVWGLIFWCVVRYRKKGDELPPQTRYNLPIEILYTVAPFLIIAVLFYYTVVVQTNVNKLTPNPDVNIEVIAQRWNWEFDYRDDTVKDVAGKDVPIRTVGTPDEIPVLVVPTGQRIRFSETSKDVIHSFWVPELLFKRDVIPGADNKFDVTIEKEGAYVGRCAELCGAYHSMMNFELRAVSPEQYRKYIEARKSGMTNAQALSSIGLPATATTTVPFDTDPRRRAAN